MKGSVVCRSSGCLNTPPMGETICRRCTADAAAEDEWDRLLGVIRNYGCDEDRFTAIADALEHLKNGGSL